MSLINEMLRDLSQQKKSNVNVASALCGAISSRQERYTPMSTRIWIYVLLLFILGCVWWIIHDPLLLQYLRPKDTKVVNNPVVNTALVSSLPAADLTATAAPSATNADVAASDLADDDDSEVVKIYQPMSAKNWQKLHYKKAMDYAKESQWDNAMAEFQSILTKYPENSEARESLVGILIMQQHYSQAQQALHEGLALAPENIPLIKMQAHLLIELHKIPEAVTLLKSHSPDMNDDADYYAMLAALYEKQGRIEKAGAIYRALVQLDTKNATYWLGLAIALDQMNNIHSAQKAYKEALGIGSLREDLRAYAAQRLQSLKG